MAGENVLNSMLHWRIICFVGEKGFCETKDLFSDRNFSTRDEGKVSISR